eukprot:494877-Lingulodinium_polyedra.AAC.1
MKHTIQGEVAAVTKELVSAPSTVDEHSILIAEHAKKIRQLEERRSLSPGGRASFSSSCVWVSAGT